MHGDTLRNMRQYRGKWYNKRGLQDQRRVSSDSCGHNAVHGVQLRYPLEATGKAGVSNCTVAIRDGLYQDF